LVRDKPEALTAPEGIDDFNREAIEPSFGNAI
jgi:hypothetical protein